MGSSSTFMRGSISMPNYLPAILACDERGGVHLTPPPRFALSWNFWKVFKWPTSSMIAGPSISKIKITPSDSIRDLFLQDHF